PTDSLGFLAAERPAGRPQIDETGRRQKRSSTKRGEMMEEKKRRKRDMDGKGRCREGEGEGEGEGGGGVPRGAEAGEEARRRLAHAFRRAPCLRAQEIPWQLGSDLGAGG
ncbi:hypothetical protein SORBI_3001G162600, partial [Sorghum bicolor]